MNFFGLPLHPLIVHASVVLIPLVALGALVIAFNGNARKRYGSLVAVLSVPVAGAAWLTKESGEALLAQRRLAGELIRTHAFWGGLVPYAAAAMVVGLSLLMLASRNRPSRTSVFFWASWIITVCSALVAVVLVILAGHAGATSVWG